VVKQLSFCHLFIVLQVVTLKSKSNIFFTLNTIVKIQYISNVLRNRLILLTTLNPVDGISITPVPVKPKKYRGLKPGCQIKQDL